MEYAGLYGKDEQWTREGTMEERYVKIVDGLSSSYGIMADNVLQRSLLVAKLLLKQQKPIPFTMKLKQKRLL